MEGKVQVERRREDYCTRIKLFPRLAFALFLFGTWTVGDWFMGLDNPTLEQAGFASTMLATAAAFFKFFMEQGENKK